MRSNILKLAAVLAIACFLTLPGKVLTQGGQVRNGRTGQVFSGPNALQNAINAAANGDTLYALGSLTGTGTITVPKSLTITSLFVATITQTNLNNCAGLTPCVFNLTDRSGPVQLINLVIKAPSGAIGVFSDGTLKPGFPLTVSNCTINGATSSAAFVAISLNDEHGGPFILQFNSVAGIFGSNGIAVSGPAALPINLTIRGNYIRNVGACQSCVGVRLRNIGAGSAVLMQNNLVDGGGPLGAFAGIMFDSSVGVGVKGAIVRNNTVSNFGNGRGISLNDADGSQVIANVLRNNLIGIQVDATVGGSSGNEPIGPPRITDNNLASTVAGATGLDFNSCLCALYNLDATNNYWGASSGPNSADGTCPETPCSAPGAGLRIVNHTLGQPACSNPMSISVNSCPFRATPNFFAGA
jgi:hypothetical protein